MNDASTDNTLSICNDLAEKDSRVKVLIMKNIGLTRSLNILLKESRGNYIARHDADDISSKDRIEKQFNFLKIKTLISFIQEHPNSRKTKGNPSCIFICPKTCS